MLLRAPKLRSEVRSPRFRSVRKPAKVAHSFGNIRAGAKEKRCQGAPVRLGNFLQLGDGQARLAILPPVELRLCDLKALRRSGEGHARGFSRPHSISGLILAGIERTMTSPYKVIVHGIGPFCRRQVLEEYEPTPTQ